MRQHALRLHPYLLNTPPNKEALRHSGGDSLLCTSPTVTLYFEVELSSDRRPGTEQNTSFMFTVTPPISPSLPSIREPTFLGGMGTERGRLEWISYITCFHIQGAQVWNLYITPLCQPLLSKTTRAGGGPGLMKRPRAGHLLLFNVARHSHYSVIDCWLAHVLKSH